MKILVTLGPASLNAEVIRELAQFKLYALRLNLSHTPLETLEESIRLIQSNCDIDVCLDSEGAQIRTHEMQDGAAHLKKGSRVRIMHEPAVGGAERLSLTPVGISRSFQPGDVLNLDFDLACVRIEEVGKDHATAVVLKSGKVGTRKAVDLNRPVPLQAVTPKDREAFRIGLGLGVRKFALSFAGSRSDVEEIRGLVGPGATVISKIESREGLANLSAILDATDEILIDRGDLSRQIPIEKIPFLQRRIISIAKIAGKPVHVATNLLESMQELRSPTRAEVNDVVSTILMGVDGLVLAAETAVGKHPVGTVRMISRIVNVTSKWTPNTSMDEILEM